MASTPATIDTSTAVRWPVLTLLLSLAVSAAGSWATTTARLDGVAAQSAHAASEVREVASAGQGREQRLKVVEAAVGDLRNEARGLDAARQAHELRLLKLELVTVRIEQSLTRIEETLNRQQPTRAVYRSRP
jgi:hypothetical protein